MKEINYLDNLVGCFGHPVSENPGVVIQEAAFKDMGVKNWRYLTIDIEKNELEGAIAALKALKMKGINCTVPLKIDVMQYLDEISESAKIIGAVNTIVNRDGRLYGDNTDGKGIMESFATSGVELKGKVMTVLGAGGAARAVCVESALAGIKKIHIINRSVDSANELARLIKDGTGVDADVTEWVGDAKIPTDTDIVAQCTSIGMYPDIDVMPPIDLDTITKDMFVQDVVMNPPESALIRALKARDIPCESGVLMLMGQAAINIEMWTGIKPNKQVMMDAFVKELEGI